MSEAALAQLAFEREKWKYRRRMTIAVEIFCGLSFLGFSIFGTDGTILHKNAQDIMFYFAMGTLFAYFGGAGWSEAAGKMKTLK